MLLPLRAESVLKPSSSAEEDLPKLFTQDFINDDAVLNSTKYDDYTVSNYYQRADVKAKIVWPWTNKVVVHAAEEIMDVTGTLNESVEAAGEADMDATAEAQIQVNVKDKNPPEWVSGEYEVTLVKDEDTSSWKVQEMKLTNLIKTAEDETGQDTSASASAEEQGAQ